MTVHQAQANYDAAAALAKALAASPPRDVVISPGARSAPLVLAMHNEPGLALHVVLDERAAAFVALGLSIAQHRAVVMVCTSGSAGGHGLPAMMEAYASGVPLVAITADRPEELHQIGALQTTEQRGLYGHHVLRQWQLPTPTPHSDVAAAWGTFGGQALHVAERMGPGPVHLNAPFREPLVPAQPERVPAHTSGSVRQVHTLPSPQEPDGAGYNALQAFVATCRAGIIVCGPMPKGAFGAAASDAVADLAAHLGWPLVVDPLSGLRFGPRGLNTLAAYDLLLAQGHKPPPCDGALVVGDVATSKTWRMWLMGTRVPVVQIHRPGRWQDPEGVTTLSVGADVAATCQQLIARIPRPQSPKEHGALWAAYAEQGVQLQKQAAQDDAHFAPGNLWPALLSALPQGAMLHVGSSMPVRDFDRYGAASARALTVSASRGLNGIDGMVATVLGLAMGHGAPTVGVMGDLTFLHDVGALQTARQTACGATLVVINNGGGAIFDHLPVAAHQAVFAAYFRTPQKADIGALCRACACGHEVVYTPAALHKALQTACTRPSSSALYVIEAVLP